MEVKAILRNLQISPRKVQLVADLVRGASVSQARIQLQHSSKDAAKALLKLLNSAVANAEHNFNLDPKTLKIKGIMVGQGPVLKRFTPRAFGRATMIRKRMSHVKIVLEGVKATNASGTLKKRATKKTETTAKKSTDEKDMEKQPAKKQERIKQSASKQKAPVDPRGLGKERKTQHKG